MGRTRGALGGMLAGCGLALLAGGCNLAEQVRLPQVEGVQRAVSEPREERTRTYQRCLKDALETPETPEADQERLLRCMRTAGFGFLAVAADHRRSHCVTALETPEVFPEAYCFQKIQ